MIDFQLKKNSWADTSAQGIALQSQGVFTLYVSDNTQAHVYTVLV